MVGWSRWQADGSSSASARSGPGSRRSKPSARLARLGRVTLVRVAMVVVATVLLAGCGSTAPESPAPRPPDRPPTACVGLAPARCDQALGILAEELPARSPSWVQVAWSLCDGPCPGAERGVWRAHLTVEFLDGGDAETVILEVDGDTARWEPIETALVRVAARSAPLAGPDVEFTLGHCGLASGIDIDGAYWDPVGTVDPSDPELINSTEARFTLTSPRTARLLTVGGTTVELVRHEGPKFLPGCD